MRGKEKGGKKKERSTFVCHDAQGAVSRKQLTPGITDPDPTGCDLEPRRDRGGRWIRLFGYSISLYA